MGNVAMFPDLKAPEEGPPEWVKDDWADFLESRIELKAPMTATAKRRLLQKIARLEAEYDRDQIRDMLDEAMIRGWKTIFPGDRPKKGAQKPAEPRRQPLSKQFIEQNARPGETYEQAEMRLRGERR